jgi:agmatine deiminase
MLKILNNTPARLGFSMPPEWHSHRATWMAWPRPEAWSFPDGYEPIPRVIATIARHIARREQLHILVPNGNVELIARRQLREHGGPRRNVFFHHIRTNECWCRDYGPAFVLRRRRDGRKSAAVVDWEFNSWGGKYPPWNDDDDVPTRIAEDLDLSVFYPRIVMEGGSVDFNGAGTVMTTESCLLNRNRNPRLSRAQIERYLKNYYGQRHVVWLGDGIVGDDTDGHVDDLARFINPTTVAVGVEDNPRDANYKALKDNLRRLLRAHDQDGQSLSIVELPMPDPVTHKGRRLPATYMNFYFINGAVLMPTFRQRRKDRAALRALREAIPGRRIIGVDCVDLIWGRGAIHCLTQQQPAW